ncbi:MAG: formimidoylglutamate deiminase [Vitreoscilla sp.]|nr:formimidoylglutamate deiminase [Burkholderiales bacterium]MBP6337813.1 formimidoylglutamate deiminase [Vitreoscilla sp.]
MADPTLLWAPLAWLPSGWAHQVLLRTAANGHWAEVQRGVATPPPEATRLPGPLLPGLVNAHSHAFQRAFAGLAERRESESDDFWSWRDRMYRAALRIAPAQLQAIAAQLYLELLQGGYTQVCEFHYLQHAPDGQPYTDPLTLGWALADAAQQVGMGLTLMPALYERAGFSQPTLRDDQRRFASSAASVHAQASSIAESARHGRPLLNAGLVVHSLRAAAPASIHQLQHLAEHFDGPIHIHVAEQTTEVDDCLAATGMRPIEWLVRERLLDERWQLVHATHAQPGEIAAVAGSGAGVVICPSTEANLGDGLPDLRGWLSAGVPLSIGSDSHVTRCWREELRWLDYGQRLLLRQRNVGAAPAAGHPSTAGRLWQRTLAGGAAAAGQPLWGLQAGARADALVADVHESALLGIPSQQTLDALVFSSPARPWQGVMVAGQWQIRQGKHANGTRIAHAFEATMAQLWGEA